MEYGITGVFEVHLPVADRVVSAGFYREVLGLELATEIPRRDITFLWIGGRGAGMLGLWGPACPNPPIPRGQSHFAFHSSIEDITHAVDRLRRSGVTPLDFDGQPTDEPIVLSWMPAISLYFRDPDGHSLELIAMLDDPPQPERGVVSWSAWQRR